MNKLHDNWQETCNTREELTAVLRDLESDTRWNSVNRHKVTFVPLRDVPEGTFTDEEMAALLDTEMPIACCIHDGEAEGSKPIYLPMRSYLWKFIKQHHMDDSRILRTMACFGAWNDICEHLNRSVPYLAKMACSSRVNINYLYRAGKVSGWFMDFNHAMTTEQQLEYVESVLKKDYPRLQFDSAEVNHMYTSVTWNLDKSLSDAKADALKDSVLDSYADAMVDAGFSKEDFWESVPKCNFVTGESGLFCITMGASLKLRDGTNLYLGEPMSVNHRGGDDKVWAKFTEFPKNITAMYKAGLDGLADLCEREIQYPASAMTHVLRTFRGSVPKENLKVLTEYYESVYPPENEETCTAISMYKEVANMLSGIKQSPVKELQNREYLARLITTNWSKFDVKKPCIPWGREKNDEGDDADSLGGI